MALALLAVLLPTLFWDQPVDTAAALRKAGIEHLSVPPGREEAWRKLGFTADPFDRAAARQAIAPGVEYHMDVASATRVPWVNANGWQFEREPGRKFFYDVPAGSAALAAAEAYAYGAETAIRTAPQDLSSLAVMLRFLGEIDEPRLPLKANIGLIDDHSGTMAEVMNLLARHNLLFQIVPAQNLNYDLTISRIPKDVNPYEFAMQIRRDLTDEKRLVRVFGSNVVLVRLTGDAKRARVHLLNYGKSPVKGLRVRVRGVYPHSKLWAGELEDFTAADGATEFTIPQIITYAVVDLIPGP